MEEVMLVLTIVSTIATVISTILAIRAKNEAKDALSEIKKYKNDIKDSEIKITSQGNNAGVIAGINAGEINYGSK